MLPSPLQTYTCRTLRQADMLLYDNASDQRRVIILATSDKLNILAESSSWYLDGTFKSSPQLFYRNLILHATCMLPNQRSMQLGLPT